MTSAYELIQKELTERQCAHVGIFPPFFNSCVGCHMLNLYNQEHMVHFEHSRLANLRLHIIMVAPRGFSKTFWLTQYLRGVQALLNETGIVTAFKDEMTTAAFKGTIKFVEGEPVRSKGVAEKLKTAIIGCEEFSTLTGSFHQQYGRGLDTALLGALDSGWVYKDLAPGEIAYQTQLTLMAGTQPARYELSGGLDRRFMWLEFIPTAKDRQMLRVMRRKGRGVRYNPVRTTKIREAVQKLQQEILGIEQITFNPSNDKYFEKRHILHFEEAMYERMIMGYLVMQGRFDNELYVSIDEDLDLLLQQEMFWRNSIRRGSDFAEVTSILVDYNNLIPMHELKDEMAQFGHDWAASSTIIENMFKYKILEPGPGTSMVKLRKGYQKRRILQ